jgi:metal-dependent HD superfamily phosphatase/phosphodiesterase
MSREVECRKSRSRELHLAEGLEDIRKGRTHGPYATGEAGIRALEARAKGLVKKKTP